MAFETPVCGDLRWYVKLQGVTNAPAVSGAMSSSYATVATVRARVKTLFGARNIAGQQTNHRVTDVFTIRKRSLDGWRYVLFNGRRYRVHQILRQGSRREWLELMAEDMGDAT